MLQVAGNVLWEVGKYSALGSAVGVSVAIVRRSREDEITTSAIIGAVALGYFALISECFNPITALASLSFLATLMYYKDLTHPYEGAAGLFLSTVAGYYFEIALKASADMSTSPPFLAASAIGIATLGYLSPWENSNTDASEKNPWIDTSLKALCAATAVGLITHAFQM